MKKPSKTLEIDRKNFFQENKRTLLTLLFFIVFGDILFIKLSYDILTFGVLIVYVILINILHLKSKLTFLFCLFLLAVMFVNFLSAGTSVPTEKAAVWLVLFMVVGVFQQWKELS